MLVLAGVPLAEYLDDNTGLMDSEVYDHLKSAERFAKRVGPSLSTYKPKGSVVTAFAFFYVDDVEFAMSGLTPLADIEVTMGAVCIVTATWR